MSSWDILTVNICINSLVIISDKFDNNFFIRLDLQHLQYETQKWCWLDISPKVSSYVSQIHCFVHQEFSWEKEINKYRIVIMQCTNVHQATSAAQCQFFGFDLTSTLCTSFFYIMMYYNNKMPFFFWKNQTDFGLY